MSERERERKIERDTADIVCCFHCYVGVARVAAVVAATPFAAVFFAALLLRFLLLPMLNVLLIKKRCMCLCVCVCE